MATISEIVTCEEHIKSLEKAKQIISGAYTLDLPKDLSLIRYRITSDIDNGIIAYTDWLSKNK